MRNFRDWPLDLPEASLRISMGMCLKALRRVPSLPFTTTSRALASTVTPSGISSSCSATMNFMVIATIKYQYLINIHLFCAKPPPILPTPSSPPPHLPTSPSLFLSFSQTLISSLEVPLQYGLWFVVGWVGWQFGVGLGYYNAGIGMQVKVITAVVRLLFNLAIVLAVFHNEELMGRVCGSFTLAPAPRAHLLTIIIVLEVLRIFYLLLAAGLQRVPLLKSAISWGKSLTSLKYVLILVLKCVLIFEETHRRKYYLHTLLLELSIVMVAVVLDCFRRENISEAGELLVLEGLHRLALVYELTQTFCPNLILYYSITNFIVFIVSQIQAQVKYGLNSSLYVKNDIYRFLCISFAYFTLTAIAQLSSYGWKTLAVYFCCFKFYISAIRSYNEGEFRSALKSLVWVGLIITILEVGFIFVGDFFGGMEM